MLSPHFLVLAPILVLAAAAIPVSHLSADSIPPPERADFIARDCVRCHAEQQETTLNHPLGVVGGAELEPMTCLSCHHEGTTKRAHTEHQNSKQDPMLSANPRRLCNSCHSPTRPNSPNSALSHGLAMGKAHLAPSSRHQSVAGLGLDSESRACLSCHDGTTASSAGVREHGTSSKMAVGSLQRIRSMHPIGVRYEWATKGSMAPQYQPQQRLPHSIRLFEGKLGCGSCHTVYGKEEQMLARSPKKGKLCLSCHIK